MIEQETYMDKFEKSASDFAGKLRMAATYPNFVLWAIQEQNDVGTEGGLEITKRRAEQVMRDALHVAEVAREQLVHLESLTLPKEEA